MTPWQLIQALAAEPGRKAKEALIASSLNDKEAATFFEGAQLAYNALITFGVKQVPVKDIAGGQGFPWKAFKQLADSLQNRELTGHAARDAIQLAMDCATQDQWNDWYRLILIKDLRCGITEKTINTVAKDAGRDELIIPVFSCQLAHDGTDHPKKCTGKKMIEVKLDGVRVLTIVYPNGQVDQFSRNGKELVNFEHIKRQFAKTVTGITEAVVFDGEVMSSSFQDLMKQVHRKSDVEAEDATLHLFDFVTLEAFNKGQWDRKQVDRSAKLKAWKDLWAEETPNVEVVEHEIVDLDNAEGKAQFKEINARAIAGGYEGIMLKDLDAKYECKRSHAWLKIKPTITLDLTVIGVEEGTGKNVGRLGALICEGEDAGRSITVNVGSGFTDEQRIAFWDDKNALFGQTVEVLADAVTRNQDGTYSLRFPRFLRFRDDK
jgi:DNA ligase 1